MMTKIEEKDYQESKWSGGTTTQLLIWPAESDYKTRKFQFRISSAIIEDEHSVFTQLPGIYRYLSILEGKLELTLEKNNKIHQEILNPFDVFTFWGDQEVKSKGKVRDFNLMLQQCKGKLKAVTVEKRQVLQSAPGCFFLYLEQGNVVVEKLDSVERPLELKAKESFYELSQESRSYVVTSTSDAKIMIAWIEV